MSKNANKRTVIPMEKLLRASEMNLKEGKAITTIAREYKCSVKALKRNMDENDIDYVIRKKTASDPNGNKKGTVTLKSYLRGLQGKKRVAAIKDEFKKGMYIKISYGYMPEVAGYRLKDEVEIKDIFKDYMLVQKEVEGISIRECIRFVDIYTEDVEVKICQVKTA